MTAGTTPESKPNRAPTLYLIASLKIGKGLLLLLAALGIFALAGKDLSDAFDDFLRLIQLDPGRKIFINIGKWLDTFSPAHVKAIASGTLLFGLFLLTSGVGLALRAAWAIWLAIGESSLFYPGGNI